MGYALIQPHGAITPEVIMGRKRLIRVVMMFAGLACADCLAVDDKTAHFGLSALFGAGAETVLHYRTDLESVDRVAVGTLLGSVPGLAKEIADSQQDGNEFSGSDLTADVAGAFFGAFLGNLLNSAIQIQVESDGGAQLSVVLGKQF